MNDIYNFSKSELDAMIEDFGFPKFRSDQIWRYLYKNNVISFNDMTNISKKLTDFLIENFYIGTLEEVKSFFETNHPKGEFVIIVEAIKK